tara:strand:+ start:726 stop:1637 length:912 start_codon:yes stop_codon:yes gene_type:complete
MKPILHINAGVGWSATKPLCYTLEREGYTHRGSATEYNMLYYMYERKYVSKHAEYFWKTNHSQRNDKDFIKEDTTIEYYIDYMKSQVKDGYRGVADFSNSNGSIPSYFLKEIAPILQDHFDITVTTIWRHPVRRSYSQVSNWYRELTENDKAPEQWKLRDESKVSLWKQIKKEYPDSISYWKHQLVEKPWHLIPSYVKIYKNYKSAFPKVLPLIMEEVWKDPSELSKFIEHSIPTMHDNVYYPERGTNRPEIIGLSDQYNSDMQDLSEDDLKYGRRKLDWLYEEFKTQFGYIPPSWQEYDQKS